MKTAFSSWEVGSICALFPVHSSYPGEMFEVCRTVVSKLLIPVSWFGFSVRLSGVGFWRGGVFWSSMVVMGLERIYAVFLMYESLFFLRLLCACASLEHS